MQSSMGGGDVHPQHHHKEDCHNYDDGDVFSQHLQHYDQQVAGVGMNQRVTRELCGKTFCIDPHYQPTKLLGKGAYGLVCACKDSANNRQVAIKKVARVYDDVIDAKRILREVKILTHLNHPGIVKLVDIVNPVNKKEVEDLYLVLEFVDTDLHKVIHSRNKLTEVHMQFIMYQLLCAVKYCHSANIIHRDLKPANILLDKKCNVKICDFGLARGVAINHNSSGANDYELTEYVVTRWYRAPEVMCNSQEYGYGCDIWALGCILAEILLKKPLFPGDNYIHQLELMFNLLGTPKEDDLEWIRNEKAIDFIKSLRPREAKPWNRLFPQASAALCDLLHQLLQFNPTKRITVQKALDHPFFAEFQFPAELDVTCDTPFDFEFEAMATSKRTIQQLLFDEIVKFRPNAVDPMTPLSDAGRMTASRVTARPMVEQHVHHHRRTLTR